MKLIQIIVYLYCLFNYCYAIRFPLVNNFKYSYIKTGSGKKKIGTNPVYLLLSDEENDTYKTNESNGYKIDLNNKDNKNNNSNKEDILKDSNFNISFNISKFTSNKDVIAPKDVNVIENNNLDEIVNNLKKRIFTYEPTLVKFKPEINLNDKNTNPENDISSNLLKISEMVTLSDRVVVPVDYNKLVSKGCVGVKEVKLMGLVMFTAQNMVGKCPKVNFVIYNFKPITDYSHFNKYHKEYIERQKYEINEAMNVFFNSFRYGTNYDSSNSTYGSDYINVSCEYVDNYNNINKILKDYYKEDTKFYHNCPSEIDNEFGSKLLDCENISKFEKDMSKVKQNRFNFSEFNQIVQNSDMYGYLLGVYESSASSFMNGMKGIMNDKNDMNLKDKVNKIVNEALKSYDNVVVNVNKGKSNEFRDRMVKLMKERLIESIRSYLYIFNKDMLSEMILILIKEHEEEISNMVVVDSLDDKLSGLISKYDSKFVNKMKMCKYSILDKYELYESMTQEMRLKLVYNLKEFSNKIMETMIKNGNYYHKFSIFDGIRFIPNKTLMNMIQKIFSKINIPMKIRLSYFSPNAFGLSNLFRSNDAREANTYVYFTGKNKDK